MKLTCDKCGHTDRFYAFDIDNVEGPVTQFLRCPKCGSAPSFETPDEMGIRILKFRVITGSQVQGVLPVIRSNVH
jgi:predicted nucleic-acid-binding Zn-ribbon protein